MEASRLKGGEGRTIKHRKQSKPHRKGKKRTTGSPHTALSAALTGYRESVGRDGEGRAARKTGPHQTSLNVWKFHSNIHANEFPSLSNLPWSQVPRMRSVLHQKLHKASPRQRASMCMHSSNINTHLTSNRLQLLKKHIQLKIIQVTDFLYIHGIKMGFNIWLRVIELLQNWPLIPQLKAQK